MGVHGLTTYLRENKQRLAKSLQYHTGDAGEGTIIVDAWSFCYELVHRSTNSPWVYGGEYAQFEQLVIKVCQAWISVGLKVYFVFDGPTPEIKFPTVISRLTKSHVQPSVLFFRTSSTSRSTPRFLHESRIIPPLIYSTCVYALKNLAKANEAIKILHADDEGDPWAVELAGRLGGFVVGNDSDFVVLNSEGYQGYIPMEEMIWTTTSPDGGPVEDEDNEFQPVKSKAKRKVPNPRSGNGIIPPEGNSDLSLSVSIYTPAKLADHLKIPVGLLPLMGALLGNDFSGQPTSFHRTGQSLFFSGLPKLSARINSTASTLSTIITASNLKRKRKDEVGSVIDLVDKAVEALLVRVRSTMGVGEVEAITNTIVDATLQYAIPKYTGDKQGIESLWPTTTCALHEHSSCPLFTRFLVSTTYEQAGPEGKALLEQVRMSYLTAYREGLFSPRILDILTTGTSWPRIFLENPDSESVARTVGRHIRQWGYSILDDGVGLPGAPNAGKGDQSAEEDDEDELVDVVEEDSDEDSMTSGDEDPLKMLRGELERIRDLEPPETPISMRSSRVSGSAPKTVTEYIRKGTRTAEEAVSVPPFIDMLTSLPNQDFDVEDPIPAQLRSEDERFALFLNVLGCDTPRIRALPADQLLVATALRWVVRTFATRAADSGHTKEKEKERWTKQEGRAYLAAFSWTPSPNHLGEASQEIPIIVDRNVQLMAQVLMALESIEEFAQILLLSGRVPNRGHSLSGLSFHAILTGAKAVDAIYIPQGLWEACEEGMDGAFGEEKKVKKINKDKATSNPGSPRKSANTMERSRSGGLFGMLGELEA